jgi:hypothetical protein
VPIDRDIIALLKSEGLKTNEAILAALTEFIDLVDEENEEMGDGLGSDDKEESDGEAEPEE